MFNNKLQFASSFLYAVLLAGPMIPGAVRYLASPYLCAAVILLLAFLNYRLYRVVGALTASACSQSAKGHCFRVNAKILAWSVLIPTAMLVGVGPITNTAAYAVDKFQRIIGLGIVNDYFVSKKVHYFIFALIIYGLLVFSFYQNIFLALANNLNNKIRRLGNFADTLLFVGWSFLLICVYRQYSGQYSNDLTLYLLKSVLIFMLPAFYFWQTGNLNVRDVRAVLALAFCSLVLSANIILYFDIRATASFSDVFAVSLLVSLFIFTVNKILRAADERILYSKAMVMALIGAFSLVFFSLSYEFFNVLAITTDRFIDIGKLYRILFGCACTFGYYYVARKQISRKTAGIAMFAFVLGISLIQFQPYPVFSSGIDIYEGANLAVPISDFYNFGKIPIFENFPGHFLWGVISSIAYAAITSDYYGALCGPWLNWLYTATCVFVLYCFIRQISNGFVAVSAAVILPYLSISTFYGFGPVVLLPFLIYIRTLKRKYLVLTVLLSIFLVTYKLDVGFSFLVAILLSSLCVSLFTQRKVIYQTLLYFVTGGAVVFALFLLTCIAKDINPISRIQEFLAVAGSNDHFGSHTLGNPENNAYELFYFVIPLLSVVAFLVTISCRAKFRVEHFAIILCLIFAYFANLPRLLVQHSLAQYTVILLSMWMWTMPLALSFLISRLLSSRSLFILCNTLMLLTVYVFFQGTVFQVEPPLRNFVNRAEYMPFETSPEHRKPLVSQVYSSGRRVTYDETGSDHMYHAGEIRTIADSLLAQDETYLDFTNQNSGYAWSRRLNPVYVVQTPSMLSGEKGQKFFIESVEEKLDKVPLAIMPANEYWYDVMQYEGIINNVRHYLVAEWIYRNYRPLFKYNDFASVWVLNSRYDEFYGKLHENRKLSDGRPQIYMAEFNGRSDNNSTGMPYCHNCVATMTGEGLKIHPTGSDPFIVDFERLIASDSLMPFSYMSLYLALDSSDDYQLFFINDGMKEYSEAYSRHSSGVSPRVKVFDLSSFGSSESGRRLRLDVPETGDTVIKTVSLSSSVFLQRLAPIDWGYDNFISLPVGAVPGAESISNAHDYTVQFLPYIWGQFDTRHAAENADLASVSGNGSHYSWNYAGHEGSSAYLRLDLDAGEELIKNSDAAYLMMGTEEDGKFSPLNRYRFKLKAGKQVYLFRISSDYYWSRGRLNAVSIDPRLMNSVSSVRILEGD